MGASEHGKTDEGTGVVDADKGAVAGSGQGEERSNGTLPEEYQRQLEAILDRKLAKERAKTDEAEKRAAEAEAKAKEATEQGIAKGRSLAKREQIAATYGISQDLLPEDDAKLDEFDQQMKVTINDRRKVIPVSVTPKADFNDFVSGVH